MSNAMLRKSCIPFNTGYGVKNEAGSISKSTYKQLPLAAKEDTKEKRDYLRGTGRGYLHPPNNSLPLQLRH